MRGMVADTVRKGGEDVESAVKFWIELQDLPEYKFARGVTLPITSDKLDTLADAMLSHKLYWGDDFSIRVLARKLNIRLVILRDGTPTIVQSETKTPTHAVILGLHREHYAPIGWRDQYVHSVGGRERYVV